MYLAPHQFDTKKCIKEIKWSFNIGILVQGHKISKTSENAYAGRQERNNDVNVNHFLNQLHFILDGDNHEDNFL
ncbi:hypothetical protein EUGRSUZ_H04634 [Eucalyptus grandis]|uniref:Uncharacterized protein n=2 Tax=Eucalyptus grandis TaxID=71139 RepID=A0ACC3JZ30_EUCGR|nr:hypothetical protein EUGRSUZ_H04634 [Eucalyptus grandis]